MVSVQDVAAFILEQRGRMTATKLQRLVYYSQAWALVWDEKPLFTERIEAWANGPVAPDLYRKHRERFEATRATFAEGDPSKVVGEVRATVLSVLRFYGDRDPQWLSDLTRAEEPWKNARTGLQPGERGDSVISHGSMYAYYSELVSRQRTFLRARPGQPRQDGTCEKCRRAYRAYSSYERPASTQVEGAGRQRTGKWLGRPPAVPALVQRRRS